MQPDYREHGAMTQVRALADQAFIIQQYSAVGGHGGQPHQGGEDLLLASVFRPVNSL